MTTAPDTPQPIGDPAEMRDALKEVLKEAGKPKREEDIAAIQHGLLQSAMMFLTRYHEYTTPLPGHTRDRLLEIEKTAKGLGRLLAGADAATLIAMWSILEEVRGWDLNGPLTHRLGSVEWRSDPDSSFVQVLNEDQIHPEGTRPLWASLGALAALAAEAAARIDVPENRLRSPLLRARDELIFSIFHVIQASHDFAAGIDVRTDWRYKSPSIATVTSIVGHVERFALGDSVSQEGLYTAVKRYMPKIKKMLDEINNLDVQQSARPVKPVQIQYQFEVPADLRLELTRTIGRFRIVRVPREEQKSPKK